MSRPETLEVALPVAHRRLIAGRLPLFCGCWVAATMLWVAVALVESEVTLLAGLLVCAWQSILLLIALALQRREPPPASTQPIAVGICIGMALGGAGFCMQQGADAAIVAMLLYAVLVTSSILFAWRSHVALLVFGATWGVWLLGAQPWGELGLTPVQGAAGAVVGAGVFMVIAESSFRGLRASVAHDLDQATHAAALAASHASYRDLAENASDLIWTAGLDWRFTYVNETAARHIGVTPAAAVGIPLRAVLTEHAANADLEAALARVATGEPVPARTLQVRPGPLHAEPRWFEISASPIHTEDGRVVGIRGMSRDVTDRERAEQALAESLKAIRASEDKLRRLAHGQAAIRDEERKRLSLDLHDDVCQELVAIGILIESARCQLTRGGPGHAELERAIGYVNEVVEHLRGLARELRPLPLQELGLEDALRALATGMSSATTPVTVDVPTPIPRLAEDTEVGIYRVAHQALGNAVRHAGARHILLHVQVADGRLNVRIEDDGQGFDVGQSRNAAIGLASMEERASALGGRLAIESEPGRGTRVQLTCKLDARTPATAA